LNDGREDEVRKEEEGVQCGRIKTKTRVVWSFVGEVVLSKSKIRVVLSF